MWPTPWNCAVAESPHAGAAYANVFRDMGRPLWVSAWGSHVLVRDIPGSERQDAVGCYPLAAFGDAPDLMGGLSFLKSEGMVSVGLVPDPLASPSAPALQAAYPVCIPFKTHYLVTQPSQAHYSKHHRYEIKRARTLVTTQEVPLAEHLPAWNALYGHLTDRHGISGLSALSPDAFSRLTEVLGLRTVVAIADGEIVSMHLWIVDETRGAALSLLAASNAEGYARSAAYAVNDESIRLFSDLQTINLGGAAGLSDDVNDGLAKFKRGFANETVQTVFCGAVLDDEGFSELAPGGPFTVTPFPAYRFPAGHRPALVASAERSR